MKNKNSCKMAIFFIVLLFIGGSMAPGVSETIRKEYDNVNDEMPSMEKRLGEDDYVFTTALQKNEPIFNSLASLDEGLVAYWNFDEGSGNIVHDISGYGYHGTIYGATWTNETPSGNGHALYFNGNNNYVQVANPVLNVPPYSVCAWVKVSSFPSVTSYIVSNGGETANSYGFYTMITTGNQWEFGGKGPDISTLWQIIRSPAATGEWYFLVGTWNGLSGYDNFKFYVNGMLTGSYLNGTYPVGQANNLRMGAPSSALNYFFHGIIDEVRIYNRSLSEIEIQTLYNQGSGNQPPVADFTWTPQNPNAGQTVTFDTSTSYDPDGWIVLYEWDWNNDGIYDESHTTPTATHSWSNDGNYPVTLRVTDNEGATGTKTKTVVVGTGVADWDVTWTYPSSSGLLEQRMGSLYPIYLIAKNNANTQMTFNYGLDYSFTPRNAYGEPITNPGWGWDESSTCILKIPPSGLTYNYPFGNELNINMNPGQQYHWDFYVNTHWQWIEPWSIDRVPGILISVGLDVLKNLLGLDFESDGYINIIQQMESIIGESAWSMEYQYYGLGDSSPGSMDSVIVWVPTAKIAFLITSIVEGFFATPLTITGLGFLAGIITAPAAAGFFAAEAALWISSEFAYFAAADPIEDYKIIAQPEPIYIPALADIPPGPSKNISETAFSYLSYKQAWNISICRYYGALENFSTEWALIQYSTAAHYAQKLLELAQILQIQLQDISSTISDLTLDDIAVIKQNLSENGLPEFEVTVLTQLGYTTDQIDYLVNYYIQLDDSFYLNSTDILLNASNILADKTVPLMIQEFSQTMNYSLDIHCMIEPSVISKGNLPDNITFYVEFENISNLTGYQITSASVNGNITPSFIATIPGDYNNNGVDDFAIEFETDDIVGLLDEGELLLSLIGTVTLPSGDTSLYSGASSILIQGLAPEIPIAPSGPNEGKTLDVLVYTTVSTDPEDSLLYYMFDWDDGNLSRWIGPYQSGGTCTVEYTWFDSGIYEIRVKAKDFWGYESDWSDPLQVTISENIPPVADFFWMPENPTNQDFVEFIDNSTDQDGFIVNWFWDFDDGNTSSMQHPIHQYSSSGIYTVCLTVWDNNGANNSITKTVEVGEYEYILLVNVEPDQGGYVTVSIDPPYYYGTLVTLTAVENPGFSFSHWSGDASGDDPEIILNMTDHKSVTAHFLEDCYSLDIDVIGNGNVIVDPEEDFYHYGITVEVTAIPEPGWIFSHWSGDLAGNVNPESLFMDADKIITAHFIMNIPYLSCIGSLNWANVKPGAMVTGSFTVQNTGDPGSLLDWGIDSYPEWGTWTFTPESGEGLTPEDGPLTVHVEVIAPMDKSTEFTGEIILRNTEEPDNTCTIEIALATPVSYQSQFFFFFQKLVELFPNVFPKLQYLLGI